MIKTINIHLTETEYEVLSAIKEKNNSTWKDMLMVSVRPKKGGDHGKNKNA